MLDGLMLSESVRSELAEATRRYHATVDQAATYLAGRGLVQGDATGHLLGYVAEPINKEHERFAGMVSIPYVTQNGVVAMKFRATSDEGQRYDAPSGQKPRLYNARALWDGGELALVVEGEFKAIVAQRLLGAPAVGTNAGMWFDHWSRALADFDRVVVVADNDVKPDGSNPGLIHARKVAKTIPGATVATPPPGLKIDDWLLQVGADAVREELGL